MRRCEMDERIDRAEIAIAELNGKMDAIPSITQLLFWAAAMVIGGVLFGFFAALLLRGSV